MPSTHKTWHAKLGRWVDHKGTSNPSMATDLRTKAGGCCMLCILHRICICGYAKTMCRNAHILSKTSHHHHLHHYHHRLLAHGKGTFRKSLPAVLRIKICILTATLLLVLSSYLTKTVFYNQPYTSPCGAGNPSFPFAAPQQVWLGLL